MKKCVIFFFGFWVQAFLAAGNHENVLDRLRETIEQQRDANALNTSGPSWRRELPAPPRLSFAADDATYLWVLRTNEGEMVFRLLPEQAPGQVLNIMYLTELGFFNGLLFHRALPDALLHSGCPLSRGFADPGYTRPAPDRSGHRFDRAGLLAAVPLEAQTDHGSQFYISLSPRPDWNGSHTLFGELITGEDVLKKLAASANPDARADGIPTLRILQIYQSRIIRRDATGSGN